jgi:iron complex outermembrane recepter protein
VRPVSSLVLLLLASAAMPALATETTANGNAAGEADAGVPVTPEGYHTQTSPEIVVTAPFNRDRFSLPTAVAVLQGAELVRQTRSTIGETLARQPGVSASWFGPNASRPILRGLDAERVRVLTDGIGSFDVSNTSVDHAVAINPLLADRIEIVRGPAALLYGSGAIGGVVNVRDLRIPRDVPDEVIHFDATGVLGSAAEERGLSGAVNVPVGKTGLVLHADGSYLRTGDYRTGGFIFSEDLRDAARAEGGEVAEEAEARGRVDNTDAKTWDIAGGFSWIGSDGGSIGLSVSHLRNNYGIPNGLELGGHDDHDGDHDDDHGDDHGDDHDDHEKGHGHEDIRLDMRQTRVDARAVVPMQGAFEELRFRFGWADYRHDEIEDSGEIGTSFFNESLEGRAELVQRERNGWKGATGVQYFARNFNAQGEEAYIPRNLTEQIGLFTLQEFAIGTLKAEIGGRWEHTSVRLPQGAFRRNFDAFSVSGGLSAPIGDNWRLAGSISHSERAPSGEELFANGAHAATRTFEIGNPFFDKERSTGGEIVLRGRGEGWRLEVSGYFNRFNNFIFLSPTGGEEEGLPVFEYLQDGARFWGLEAEGAVTVARLGETRIQVTGLADFVRADLLNGGGRVPRIPPLRFIGGVEADGGDFGGRLEVEHVTRQSRIAAFESETPAFTMVNASVSWRPFGADNATTVIASANNIFDVEGRRHASFLKDVAPLLGRDFRLAVRFAF